jgi:hypothetical protein
LLRLPRVNAGSKANTNPACSARLFSAWLKSPAGIEKLRTALLACAPETDDSAANSGAATKAIATESASGCNGRAKRDMGNPAKWKALLTMTAMSEKQTTNAIDLH